jgi:hypothetical protein
MRHSDASPGDNDTMSRRTVATVVNAARPAGLCTPAPSAGDRLRYARLLFALTVALGLLFIPIVDPWLALTVRGLAIAFVLLFLLTPYRRWIVSGCLTASVLLMAPSIFGEQSGLPGTGLAVLAAVLSVFCQLSGAAEKERDPRGLVLVPLLLLCGYWALLTFASTLDQAATLLVYSLISVAVVIVFQRDPGAVRGTLILMSFFVAGLGYAWLLTSATYAILGLEPATVTRSAYGLRADFGYMTWGPSLITNSRGLFGLMRASEISGEPGAWALFAVLGAASAGIVFADRHALRRVVLTGGVLAVISSQSGGAIVSLLAAVAATLAFTAARRGPVTGARHRFPLVVLAGIFAIILPFILRFVINLKMSENVDSLIVRGIGFLSGTRSSAVESRISLVSALAVDGVVALLPVLGLVALIVLLRHNPYSFALAVFFSFMGLLIQPVQWYVGIWFACVLLAAVVPRRDLTGLRESIQGEREGIPIAVPHP